MNRIQSFSPKKIHHLIYYIINNVDHELGTVELVKFVYLVDVAFYRLFGKTISGLEYIREIKGPYTRDITEAATDLEWHEIDRTIKKSKNNSSIKKIAHSKGSNPRFAPELDAVEEEVVKRVIKSLKNLSPRQIEEKAYSTEPMVTIQKMEEKVGQILKGTVIDFNEIERNPFMEELMKNREVEEKEDFEYEQLLRKEKDEFFQLLN